MQSPRSNIKADQSRATIFMCSLYMEPNPIFKPGMWVLEFEKACQTKNNWFRNLKNEV